MKLIQIDWKHKIDEISVKIKDAAYMKDIDHNRKNE